jgi:DNA polymerase III sliding clamp (beta) subunit (PCNA family)
MLNQTSNLLSAVQLCRRVLKTRTTLPILGFLRLEAKTNPDGAAVLSIRATDLGRHVERTVDFYGEPFGPVCVPAKDLEVALNQMGKNVTLAVRSGSLLLSGDAKAKLPTVAADEFPELPAAGTLHGCDARELSDVIREVYWAADTNEALADETLVCAVKMTARKILAEAGRRYLVARSEKLSIAADATFSFPAKDAPEVAAALLEEDAQIRVSEDWVSVHAKAGQLWVNRTTTRRAFKDFVFETPADAVAEINKEQVGELRAMLSAVNQLAEKSEFAAVTFASDSQAGTVSVSYRGAHTSIEREIGPVSVSRNVNLLLSADGFSEVMQKVTAEKASLSVVKMPNGNEAIQVRSGDRVAVMATRVAPQEVKPENE